MLGVFILFRKPFWYWAFYLHAMSQWCIGRFVYSGAFLHCYGANLYTLFERLSLFWGVFLQLGIQHFACLKLCVFLMILGVDLLLKKKYADWSAFCMLKTLRFF